MKPEERAFVYMLRCPSGQLYTGWTNDPAARFFAHKNGKGAKYTHAMGAKELVYLERCENKSAALRREAAIKRLQKHRKEALCAAWAEKSRPRLSIATRADAAEIMQLYNWYVENSTATFQITPSVMPDYEAWVENAGLAAPMLLARDGDGRLLGYACAHRWREREAFDWDVETTVYCAPEARSVGVGAVLYSALLGILSAMGYCNAYAHIADPNPESESFHKKFGFKCICRAPHTAYKSGRWLGLGIWWLALRSPRSAPAPVRRLTDEELAGYLTNDTKS